MQQGSENEERKSDVYSKAVRMKRGSLNELYKKISEGKICVCVCVCLCVCV